MPGFYLATGTSEIVHYNFINVINDTKEFLFKIVCLPSPLYLSVLLQKQKWHMYLITDL